MLSGFKALIVATAPSLSLLPPKLRHSTADALPDSSLTPSQVSWFSSELLDMKLNERSSMKSSPDFASSLTPASLTLLLLRESSVNLERMLELAKILQPLGPNSL